MKHTVGECPLGAKCSKVINEDTIEHCPWHIELEVVDNKSGTNKTIWQCAIASLPQLLIENAQTNRGQTKAIESMRNETVKRQDIFNALAVKSIAIKNEGEKL